MLRSPYLVAITATLFVIDLFFPDEILLGLATLILARIRRNPLPWMVDGGRDDAA